MFDFILPQIYSKIYYYVLLLLVVYTYMRATTVKLDEAENLQHIKILELSLLVFVTFYMGLRPISPYFGDMINYASHFESNKYALRIEAAKDYLFEVFVFYCSKIMNVQQYLFLCAALYIVPVWLGCKKYFKEYSFYAFLAAVVSFSFWAYGTNGIRNGIATSFFIYGLSREKLWSKALLFFLAIGFHKTLALPVAAYVLTLFVTNPIWYFRAWFLAIPLSLAAGGVWEALFSGFMEDDRTAAYFVENSVESEVGGFRWDFVLYSAMAVYTAYFFIIKKKFTDATYQTIVGIYLAANAFWILVIRANFSNRFAYLSWFLIALVMFYPFLTNKFFQKQHKILGTVLLGYFAFTFLMNVILA